MDNKKSAIQDTWEDVANALIDATLLSCLPDRTKFPLPRKGEFIDEEKSVRWNREERERLSAAYDEEVKRLNIQKNDAVNAASQRAITLIAKDANISKEKASSVWRFMFEKHHGNVHEIINTREEYIKLAKTLARPEKKKGPPKAIKTALEEIKSLFFELLPVEDQEVRTQYIANFEKEVDKIASYFETAK